MVKSNKVADKNLEILTIPAENQANSTKNATRNNLTKKKIALLAITIGMGKLCFISIIQLFVYNIFNCSICWLGFASVPAALILSKWSWEKRSHCLSVWLGFWYAKFGSIFDCSNIWKIWHKHWPQVALQFWSFYSRFCWSYFWVPDLFGNFGTIFRTFLLFEVIKDH